MDTALPQKFPFILDRNLAKAHCTGNRVCTSCDTVVFGQNIYFIDYIIWVTTYFMDRDMFYRCAHILWMLIICYGREYALTVA